MTVQWFPGHMAKARRLLTENIKLVDLVIELRDARVPEASANPLLRGIIGKRQRLVVLAKADLAAANATESWLEYFKTVEKTEAVALDLRDRRSVNRILSARLRDLTAALAPRSKRGGIQLRPGRCMVVGIPNIGKSTLINTLSGRSVAKTGALPGVTRGKQWIKLEQGLELLDTPGLLWPKFEDPLEARLLAVTGAVGQAGFNEVELAAWLLHYLAQHFPDLLGRYGMTDLESGPEGLLEAVGRARGCLLPGGVVDSARAALLVLGDFRSGKLGKATLEMPSRGRKN